MPGEKSRPKNDSLSSTDGGSLENHRTETESDPEEPDITDFKSLYHALIKKMDKTEAKLEKKIDKNTIQLSLITDKNLPQLKKQVDEMKTEQTEMNDRILRIENKIDDTTNDEKINEIISDNNSRDQRIATIERQVNDLAENQDQQNESDKAALASMFEELANNLNEKIEEKLTVTQGVNHPKPPNLAQEIEEAIREPEVNSIQQNVIQQETRKNYIDALLKTPHPNQIPERVINEPFPKNAEEIMKVMSTTVGLKNITSDEIKKWAHHKSVDAINHTDSDTVLYGSEFEEARNNLVYRRLHFDLQMPQSRIKNFTTRMCKKKEEKILWIQSDEDFIRKIYVQASQVKNPDIELMQFTPGPARKKEKGS